MVNSKYVVDGSQISLPNAVPEMTISSGVPSDWSDGLGVLDGTVKFEPYPRKRPKRLGFDEMLELVLGVMLGVEAREGGNDVDNIACSSKPPGKTTL